MRLACTVRLKTGSNMAAYLSLVKHMFLFPVRYRLGMMLRTYRECAKVVTSFELQNTSIRGGHKLLYD